MLKLISKTFGLLYKDSHAYNMVAVKVSLWDTAIDLFFVYNPDGSVIGFMHDLEPKDLTESQQLFLSYVYDGYIDVPQYS